MARYKVPQDVEADDKLLGPFNFRQFIYLLIVAALIALAWAMGQIFPLLAIIPVPFALFLLILALPLRKDQPMETYIAALISFYTKPNKRYWFPGQRESTIVITAPKIVEQSRTRDITEEEAGRRLSFLANVVDSEGYSIKEGFSSSSAAGSTVRDEFIAEAESTPDIFESYQSDQVNETLTSEADRYRNEVIEQMRAAIAANNPVQPVEEKPAEPAGPSFNAANLNTASAPSQPPAPAPASQTATASNSAFVQAPPQPTFNPDEHERLIALSKNKEFTVATIAKEANRKSSHKTDENEVYISLH